MIKWLTSATGVVGISSSTSMVGGFFGEVGEVKAENRLVFYHNCIISSVAFTTSHFLQVY